MDIQEILYASIIIFFFCFLGNCVEELKNASKRKSSKKYKDERKIAYVMVMDKFLEKKYKNKYTGYIHNVSLICGNSFERIYYDRHFNSIIVEENLINYPWSPIDKHYVWRKKYRTFTDEPMISIVGQDVSYIYAIEMLIHIKMCQVKAICTIIHRTIIGD